MKWYPQLFIGFQLGVSLAAKVMRSVVSRSDTLGSKIEVPRATNSLSRSFCVVPRSWARATPWRSATAS
jgi:hypothetical protein